MTDLRTSVVIDLTGNLERRAQRNSRALNQFSQRGRRDLSRLSRAANLAGKGLDRVANRYTGLLTGAAAIGTGKMVMGLELRFARLGIQANKSAEEMNALKREIYDAAQAPDIRVDPGEITSAVEAIVEKTGDLDFARENLRNLGLTIQATGAQGAAVGELAAELQKLESFKGPGEVLKAIDTLTVQGKEGAFTLENLAALGPRVISAYAGAVKGGRDGATILKEMGAALQVIRMGTGSSEQAATAFERLLAELQNVEKLKKLQRNGIQVFDPKQPGAEIMRPINELLLEIMEKTQGRKTLLGQVFGDESIRAFNALTPERIEKFMAVQGDGSTTMRDSARAADTASAALTNVYTAWKRFADSELTGPIQSLADALNSLDKEQMETIMNTLKWGGAALGSAILLRKTAGVVGAARRGGAKGALGEAAGLGGMGVTPVYVVNMGGGMGGFGGGRRGGPGGLGRNARTFSRARTTAALLGGTNISKLGMYGAGAWGMAGLGVTAAGAAGYGVGTLINKTLIEGTDLGDKIGEGIARTLAFFGNDEAQQAVANQEKYEEMMKGEVTVRVKTDPGLEASPDQASADRRLSLSVETEAGVNWGAF